MEQGFRGQRQRRGQLVWLGTALGVLQRVWSQRRRCVEQGPDREQRRVPGRWAQAGRGTRSGWGSRGRGVPSPYPFQHLLQVVSELHEQVDLPAGVAVHRVDLGKYGETREAGQAPSPGGVGGAEGPEWVRGDQPSAHE